MRENLLIVGNYLVSYTWLFVLLGLVHMLIVEKQNILAFVKQKKMDILLPLLKRALYLVAGLVLIYFSFVIVNFILNVIMPASITEIDYGQAKDFWTALKYQTQYTGLISTIGFTISGIFLLLSAGRKLLVNLAKVFVGLTVLYLILSVLIVYFLK